MATWAVWLPALGVLTCMLWGRRLRRGDDALAAQRWAAFRLRAAVGIGLLCGVTVPLLELPAAWLLPMLWVSCTLALFPARRRMLDESWSLLTYMQASLRYVLFATGGIIVLALLPALVDALPMSPRIGALLAFALACVLSELLLRALPQLLGTREFEPGPELERVLTAARCKRPRVYVTRDYGGRFANAFALPSIRFPRVVLGHTLVAALSPAELAAIFAHELAHLEEFSNRKLRTISEVWYGLLLVGALLVPMMHALHLDVAHGVSL